MTHAILTRGLSRRYGRTEALHPLDLAIPQGPSTLSSVLTEQGRPPSSSS